MIFIRVMSLFNPSQVIGMRSFEVRLGGHAKLSHAIPCNVRLWRALYQMYYKIGLGPNKLFHF